MKNLRKSIIAVTMLATAGLFSNPANAWTCHSVSWWSIHAKWLRPESKRYVDWPPGTEVSYVTVERLPDGQWTILQHMTAGEPIADFNKIFVITDKPDDLDALGQYTGTTSEVKYWTRAVTGKVYLKNGVLTYTEWYYDKNGTLVIQMDAECDDQKVS